MGNNELGTNYGPVGVIEVFEATGERIVKLDQGAVSDALGGESVYMVEPALYEIARKITEGFKQYDAERFEPVKSTFISPITGQEVQNGVTVPVYLLRGLEAFMDAAGRTAPLADKARELFLSGRASERWVKVAKPWQIGAAFANPTVGCSLTLTDDGYAAALVEAPSWV